MRSDAQAAWPFGTISRRSLLLGLLRGAVGGVALAALPRPVRARLLQDESIVLAILGILQPASAEDVHCLLTVLYETADARSLELASPEAEQIASVIDRLSRSGSILPVRQAPQPVYSITASGNRRLGRELRGMRDRTRLFLLHGPRRRIILGSREGREGVVGGESPLLKLRLHIEEIGRPFGPGDLRGSAILPHARENSAELWLRRCRTSPLVLSRGATPRFLSFDSLAQLSEAEGASPAQGTMTVSGLALSLGVSSELLRWLRFDRRTRHYRHFTIPKKGGGQRRIESPRLFLKVVQRFILHYLLTDQTPHNAVYSFVASTESSHRRNAVSNAQRHVGRSYLAKIDIADFFGSLRHEHVLKVFEENRLIDRECARLLALLCTIPDERELRAYLPQGAPTSPMISNLSLQRFDEEMATACDDLGLTYTRYADDIAISGDNRRNVRLAALLARRKLGESPLQLTIHPRKSRFVTAGEQQRVTGVVVNEAGLPPRKLRRRVRSMFHQASLDPARVAAERKRLLGFLSYFRSFPNYPQTELGRYARILRQA